jgi:hypothetical protein
VIEVQVRDGYTAFRPGDVVEGTVSWQLEPGPKEIEARLFWYTRGKGDQDVGIVETLPYADPAPADRRPFRFRLPRGPFSFSGKLISLAWAIEAVAQPGEEAGRVEITVSPTGDEIRLAVVPPTPPTPDTAAP